MLDRRVIFGLLSLGSAVALILYIRDFQTRPAEVTAAPLTIGGSASTKVYFRYNGLDANFGKLAYVRAGDTEPRFVDGLSCEVVHVAAGRGICLTADRGVFTTYAAKLFDATTYEVGAQFPLKGIPSRTRVSKDGRYAALTVFVTGHNYASVDFSTQTLLIDLENASVVADLEQFAVTRDGERFANPDFNFWGVTFTPDGKKLYATLSTSRRHYLVEADIDRRAAVVLHDNVECPSVSPNGKRIAYKKRFVQSGRVLWQLHVLDLETRSETPIAERRSVDDQIEWLDDHYVLYSVPETDAASSPSTHVWRAAADGGGAPELFLPRAYSPAVVREEALASRG